jgi:hypothetical protein
MEVYLTSHHLSSDSSYFHVCAISQLLSNCYCKSNFIHRKSRKEKRRYQTLFRWMAISVRAQAMASLCLAPLPPPPPSQPRKLSEPSYSSSLNSCSHITGGALKPIVVNGNPPTFVSAPGRRIVAGLFPVSSLSFLVYLAFQIILRYAHVFFVGIFSFFFFFFFFFLHSFSSSKLGR